MNATQLWLFAGPNGAGKSTLAKSPEFARLFAPPFLNPDDLCLRLLIQNGFDGFQDAPPEIQRICSIEAANSIYRQVETHLNSGQKVGVETVLSTDKYLNLSRNAGQTRLIYIGNQSPEISVERVALRVRKGGHDVPIDKIRGRWHRSLEFLPVFWTLSHQAWIFDNSELPTLVAQKHREGTEFLAPSDGNVLLQALIQGGIQPGRNHN